MLLYKPWRRRVDRYRQSLASAQSEQAGLCTADSSEEQTSGVVIKKGGQVIESEEISNVNNLDIERAD